MYNPPLEQINQRLTGSVYVGVAEPEIELGAARDSIESLQLRPGDGRPVFHRFTKGFEARQAHIEKFLETQHDFIVLLDGDMQFTPDYIERLRSHGLPVVSGVAYRRTYRPTVTPAWYEDDPAFRWPMQPFTETPVEGRLYRLGATGFFGVIIHRSVFEALVPILKGEPFVCEDDMDVWPYDLRAVLRGEEQIRVLRGEKDNIGADLRLCYFIRRAGFAVWGDPAAHAGHYINYPVGIDDYAGFSPAFRAYYNRGVREQVETMRAAHDTAVAELMGVGA